jgi:hypothetical protein
VDKKNLNSGGNEMIKLSRNSKWLINTARRSDMFPTARRVTKRLTNVRMRREGKIDASQQLAEMSVTDPHNFLTCPVSRELRYLRLLKDTLQDAAGMYNWYDFAREQYFATV